MIGVVSARQEVMGMEERRVSKDSLSVVIAHHGISGINHWMQSDHQILINLSY